jgi:hypothetical protein
MLDVMWFEVEYADGRIHSETTGLTYAKIDRASLKKFRIVDNVGPLVELEVGDDRTGWNVVWRKRTVEIEKQVVNVYVLGWVPNGPIFAVDERTQAVYQAPFFIPGDAVFYPPVPNRLQGEVWPITKSARIVNPSLERTS